MSSILKFLNSFIVLKMESLIFLRIREKEANFHKRMHAVFLRMAEMGNV